MFRPLKSKFLCVYWYRIHTGRRVPKEEKTYGAQVMAYPRINKHALTIITWKCHIKIQPVYLEVKDVHFPIPGSLLGTLAVPAAANTKSQKDCHTPPNINGNRLPYYEARGKSDEWSGRGRSLLSPWHTSRRKCRRNWLHQEWSVLRTNLEYQLIGKSLHRTMECQRENNVLS